ncbi:MAG TPA: hypothetical protein VKX16_04010 [Chloroflexota bacterium]|nr:hypothetical protein [Chloroflexota bacterium]
MLGVDLPRVGINPGFYPPALDAACCRADADDLLVLAFRAGTGRPEMVRTYDARRAKGENEHKTDAGSRSTTLPDQALQALPALPPAFRFP